MSLAHWCSTRSNTWLISYRSTHVTPLIDYTHCVYVLQLLRTIGLSFSRVVDYGSWILHTTGGHDFVWFARGLPVVCLWFVCDYTYASPVLCLYIACALHLTHPRSLQRQHEPMHAVGSTNANDSKLSFCLNLTLALCMTSLQRNELGC